MNQPRINVLVLFGGKSTEHEVSCRSAAFILRNLDRERFNVRAVGIDKDGRWWPQQVAALPSGVPSPVPILKDTQALAGDVTVTSPGECSLALIGGAGVENSLSSAQTVIFPIIHGSSGEDGTLQGFLDLAGLPYVGPDTTGSAVGMDKGISKLLAASAGIEVVPWIEVRSQQYAKNGPQICARAVQELGLPLFVKPARLGSSVGVSKVKEASTLHKACLEALSFDDKILIEKGLEVREIELAALGDYEPMISEPGEVIAHSDFYSYEAKYVDKAASSVAIPADLTPEQVRLAKEMAYKVFTALNLYGMARVDLFLEKGTGRFYFNEVNTIPGFTEISQYPMLWKHSGVSNQELLSKLVDLAIKRWEHRKNLRTSVV